VSLRRGAIRNQCGTHNDASLLVPSLPVHSNRERSGVRLLSNQRVFSQGRDPRLSKRGGQRKQDASTLLRNLRHTPFQRGRVAPAPGVCTRRQFRRSGDRSTGCDDLGGASTCMGPYRRSFSSVGGTAAAHLNATPRVHARRTPQPSRFASTSRFPGPKAAGPVPLHLARARTAATVHFSLC
jgi:hypothetical protein